MTVSRRHFLYAAGAFVTGGAAAGGYAAYVEPNRVDFTEQSVPARWPSFAHVTDLHLREILDMHAAIGAEIERHGCSFLVFSGDSIDRREDGGLLDEFLSLMPAIPKFAIFGNWERWGGIEAAELARIYERWNGRLLVNESVQFEDTSLIGLDDLVAGKPDLSKALATNRSADGPRLLLAHCPAQRDRLPPDEHLDLVLSGHTHGGQVRLLGMAPFTPNGSGAYVSGWYRNGTPLFVSRGVGTSIMPIRFGCRPEVAFFNPRLQERS